MRKSPNINKQKKQENIQTNSSKSICKNSPDQTNKIIRTLLSAEESLSKVQTNEKTNQSKKQLKIVAQDDGKNRKNRSTEHMTVMNHLCNPLSKKNTNVEKTNFEPPKKHMNLNPAFNFEENGRLEKVCISNKLGQNMTLSVQPKKSKISRNEQFRILKLQPDETKALTAQLSDRSHFRKMSDEQFHKSSNFSERKSLLSSKKQNQESNQTPKNKEKIEQRNQQQNLEIKNVPNSSDLNDVNLIKTINHNNCFLKSDDLSGGKLQERDNSVWNSLKKSQDGIIRNGFELSFKKFLTPLEPCLAPSSSRHDVNSLKKREQTSSVKKANTLNISNIDDEINFANQLDVTNNMNKNNPETQWNQQYVSKMKDVGNETFEFIKNSDGISKIDDFSVQTFGQLNYDQRCDLTRNIDIENWTNVDEEDSQNFELKEQFTNHQVAYNSIKANYKNNNYDHLLKNEELTQRAIVNYDFASEFNVHCENLKEERCNHQNQNQDQFLEFEKNQKIRNENKNDQSREIKNNQKREKACAICGKNENSNQKSSKLNETPNQSNPINDKSCNDTFYQIFENKLENDNNSQINKGNDEQIYSNNNSTTKQQNLNVLCCLSSQKNINQSLKPRNSNSKANEAGDGLTNEIATMYNNMQYLKNKIQHFPTIPNNHESSKQFKNSKNSYKDTISGENLLKDFPVSKGTMQNVSIKSEIWDKKPQSSDEARKFKKTNLEKDFPTSSHNQNRQSDHSNSNHMRILLSANSHFGKKNQSENINETGCKPNQQNQTSNKITSKTLFDQIEEAKLKNDFRLLENSYSVQHPQFYDSYENFETHYYQTLSENKEIINEDHFEKSLCHKKDMVYSICSRNELSKENKRFGSGTFSRANENPVVVESHITENQNPEHRSEEMISYNLSINDTESHLFENDKKIENSNLDEILDQTNESHFFKCKTNLVESMSIYPMNVSVKQESAKNVNSNDSFKLFNTFGCNCEVFQKKSMQKFNFEKVDFVKNQEIETFQKSKKESLKNSKSKLDNSENLPKNSNESTTDFRNKEQESQQLLTSRSEIRHQFLESQKCSQNKIEMESKERKKLKRKTVDLIEEMISELEFKALSVQNLNYNQLVCLLSILEKSSYFETKSNDLSFQNQSLEETLYKNQEQHQTFGKKLLEIETTLETTLLSKQDMSRTNEALNSEIFMLKKELEESKKNQIMFDGFITPSMRTPMNDKMKEFLIFEADHNLELYAVENEVTENKNSQKNAEVEEKNAGHQRKPSQNLKKFISKLSSNQKKRNSHIEKSDFEFNKNLVRKLMKMYTDHHKIQLDGFLENSFIFKIIRKEKIEVFEKEINQFQKVIKKVYEKNRKQIEIKKGDIHIGDFAENILELFSCFFVDYRKAVSEFYKKISQKCGFGETEN